MGSLMAKIMYNQKHLQYPKGFCLKHIAMLKTHISISFAKHVDVCCSFRFFDKGVHQNHCCVCVCLISSMQALSRPLWRFVSFHFFDKGVHKTIFAFWFKAVVACCSFKFFEKCVRNTILAFLLASDLSHIDLFGLGLLKQ